MRKLEFICLIPKELKEKIRCYGTYMVSVNWEYGQNRLRTKDLWTKPPRTKPPYP